MNGIKEWLLSGSVKRAVRTFVAPMPAMAAIAAATNSLVLLIVMLM